MNMNNLICTPRKLPMLSYSAFVILTIKVITIIVMTLTEKD